ncbi:DUF4430 domain-containing protein [Hazenella sp. IB182353]|uniref:DUF4430 domain-containing protein n=1 Tax=Polycladospora coralii TaxID=2771432 RepID=UPI001746C999|nr:DUF4430 domain-containing protein [Polycladospora coralii]MBS7530175.1 DUF4430 domain-containing protein [Polycladospora coralii]
MRYFQRSLTVLFAFVLMFTMFPSMAKGETTAKVLTSQVKLSVTGDSIHGVIQPKTDVNIQTGDTAFDVLINTLGTSEVDYMGSGSSIYVRGINNLYEFDRGPLSGWLYRVNGSFPNYSAGSYVLKNSDEVEWLYTTNGGADVGFNPWGLRSFNLTQNIKKNKMMKQQLQ